MEEIGLRLQKSRILLDQAPNAPSGEQSDAQGLKALLLAMPDVGYDADFARIQDPGRGEPSWDA